MELRDFFAAHPRAALAFSGGVDSAYLLYAGLQAGAEIRPYYVRTQFQPEFEYQDAMRLCASLGVEPAVIPVDALAVETVRRNGPDRCYYCKINIMSTIIRRAAADGFTLVLDGTNASDDSGDRPGMRALTELGVLSPLRLCGLRKPEIRRLSREAGLFTWDKPAYACLATRIRRGEEITQERLKKVEAAEEELFRRGYRDFRVRSRGEDALLQVTEEQLPQAMQERAELVTCLSAWFRQVEIDPEGRGKSL